MGWGGATPGGAAMAMAARSFLGAVVETMSPRMN